MLSEAEQKKIAEMIEDVEKENKERMWDNVSKRYRPQQEDDPLKMSKNFSSRITASRRC